MREFLTKHGAEWLADWLERAAAWVEPAARDWQSLSVFEQFVVVIGAIVAYRLSQIANRMPRHAPGTGRTSTPGDA